MTIPNNKKKKFEVISEFMIIKDGSHHQYNVGDTIELTVKEFKEFKLLSDPVSHYLKQI